jgi:hypothetical protein
MSNGTSFFGSTIGSIGKVFSPSPTVKFTPLRTLDKSSRTFANGNSISSNTSTASSSTAFIPFSSTFCGLWDTYPPWNSAAYGFNASPTSPNPPSPRSICVGWSNNIDSTFYSRKTTVGETSWSKFKKAFVDTFPEKLANAPTDYTGLYGGTTLYHRAVYGTGGAVERYSAGDFGPVGSLQAIRQLDAIKGYLGREFLVKAAVQGAQYDAIKAILDTAVSENTSVRVSQMLVDNNLTSIPVSATSAVIGFLVNIGYQSTQAWEVAQTSNTPLYKSIINEFYSLGRQTLGELYVAPPAWLNGKTYTGTLGNGDTVQYTFSSSSYTRTVTPP